MNCSCLIDTSRWGYRQGNIFLEMMAMYCFFIRNYGKYFFRLGDRESYFSRNMGQKTASISSECGNFLLLFASSVSTRAIPADHVNFLVTFQPGEDGFSSAVRYQIERVPCFQVDQNGSVAVPAPDGKVINPYHSHQRIRRRRNGAQ